MKLSIAVKSWPMQILLGRPTENSCYCYCESQLMSINYLFAEIREVGFSEHLISPLEKVCNRDGLFLSRHREILSEKSLPSLFWILDTNFLLLRQNLYVCLNISFLYQFSDINTYQSLMKVMYLWCKTSLKTVSKIYYRLYYSCIFDEHLITFHLSGTKTFVFSL